MLALRLENGLGGAHWLLADLMGVEAPLGKVLAGGRVD
eukprot:COSAG01_NODE_10845_length_2068_cov_38.191468_2_plen_38_part_00